MPDPNDPRINLAAVYRGVNPSLHSVAAGLAALRKNPDAEAEQVNELRFGDRFAVYEQREGWAYGQSARDHYVGHVRMGALGRLAVNITHRVSNTATFLFPEPSIKAPPLDRLTYLSAVEVTGAEEKFCEIKGGGFVHREHLRPLNQWPEKDPVAIAMRFMDVPYLWGGVSPLGCDCSGLIQAALEACGVPCPRDSDMQAESLGRAAEPNALQRGDIVCFKGHIGFMADGQSLLHANAHHGRVMLEPLAEVIARGSTVTAVRRLGP